jgi:hypothetical protein
MPWLPDEVWMLQKLMNDMGMGGMEGMGGMGGGGAYAMGNGGADKGFGKGKFGKVKQPPPAKKVKQPPPTKKVKVEDPTKPWKSRLIEAHTKMHKTPVSKDLFQFTTVQDGEGFTSTLMSEAFSSIYTSPEVQPSKKAAEDAAAKLALQAEFPEAFAVVPKAVRNKAVAKMKAKAKAAPVQMKLEKGVKRKATDAAPGVKGVASDDPKSKLAAGMALVLERSVTKDDIVYAIETVGDKLIATVTLSIDGTTIRGKPVPEGSKKKDAEGSAAFVALGKFAAQIKQAKQVHALKKDEQHKARQEVLKAKYGDAYKAPK